MFDKALGRTTTNRFYLVFLHPGGIEDMVVEAVQRHHDGPLPVRGVQHSGSATALTERVLA